jgi:3'-phosphoadenosine 5'-phosphosulfate sulfotransferase (PAPS reductase)/FAD synthetase
VSGGHDSVSNAYVSADILNSLAIPFAVYHGDTTIGIPETQEYVKSICQLNNWQLFIRRPPKEIDWYGNIVAKYGFPGPTKSSHQYMYRRLKERALRHFVTHECKSSPKKRENVLLLSGVRKQESQIRMGYVEEINKDASRVWANPIFYWSEEDVKEYMIRNNIPRNPVKEKMCISGECLCGAFATTSEWTELKINYPEVAKRIEALHQIAISNGNPWHWSSGPNQWKKEQKSNKGIGFMCVGCESKVIAA